VGDIREALGQQTQAEQAYRQAVGRYQSLITLWPQDAGLHAELAETYLNLWIVQAGLEKRGDAADSLTRAHALLADLVRTNPNHSIYRRDLALCCNNEGIHASTEVPPDLNRAEASFSEALRLFSALPVEEQRKPTCLLDHARTEKNLAALNQKRGQLADSVRLAESALGKLEQLLAAAPDRVDFRKEYGQVSANLAVLLIALDELPRAQRVCDEVVARYSDLAQQFPEVVDHRHLLALALTTRADVQRCRDHLEQARQDLDQARALLERLVADQPDQPGYVIDLARTLNQLGVVLLRTRQADKGLAAWERTLTLCAPLAQDPRRADARHERERVLGLLIAWYDARCRVLLGREPVADALPPLTRLAALRQMLLSSSEAYPEEGASSAAGQVVLGSAVAFTSLRQEQRRGELASTRLALAELLVGLRHREVASQVLHELTTAPPSWPKYSEAALLAARCFNLLRDDPGLTESQRREQWEGSRSLVLLLLRKAGQCPHLPTAGLLDDPAFAPLRSDPEFRNLRTSFEQHEHPLR
jgi:tetratricopeptide (TPR) repeat protein